MLKRTGNPFLAILCMFAMLCGCSRERARAPEIHPQTEVQEKKDYRDLIEHARMRQSSQDDLSGLAAALNQFLKAEGHLPSNLVELVDRKYLPALPSAPAGSQFAYDPASGNIRVVPLPEGTSPPAANPP